MAIVKALLDHGANPNSEEGAPLVKYKHGSLKSTQRNGEEEKAEGEKMNSRDEGPGTLNKVMFLVGNEDSATGEHAYEGGRSEFASTAVAQAPAVVMMSVLAGDNPGRPGYTPLHLLCSTETNASNTTTTTGTPATAQQMVRRRYRKVIFLCA